jgi:hypothetical protein
MTETNRTPDRGTQQLRGAAPKSLLRSREIEAKINAIVQHGVGGASLSTVTEDTDLSAGLAHVRFKSPQGLLEDTKMHPAKEPRDHWQEVLPKAGLPGPERLTPRDLTGRPRTE